MKRQIRTILSLLCLALLLSGSAYAQDSTILPDTPTEIPTSTATDTPTETPTETLPSLTPTATLTPETLPTSIPTIELSTITPTDTATPEAATAAPLATATATASLAPAAAEPPLGLLGSDMFNTQPLTGWSNGPGWAYVPHNAGQALQVFNSNQPIQWIHTDLYNVVAQASFQNSNGTAQLSVRVGGTGGYSVLLDPAGQVSLLRAGQLFSSASVPATTPGQWRTLRLSAMGGTLRVAVDGAEVIALEDAAPLPPGTITLGGWFTVSADAQLPQNTVQLDDFAALAPQAELPATAAPIPPPSTPSPTAIPTILVLPTDTQVPTFTSTPTATPTPTGLYTSTPSPTPTMTFTPLGALTFTVNTTSDSSDGSCDVSHCSLREAILAANTTSVSDTIVFNINGGGAQTITLTTALPDITYPVVIDGSTQPGYSGKPLIELNGNNLANISGLRLTSANSTVRGLVINRMGLDGIQITGTGANIVENSYIGTDSSGDNALPNGRHGIYIINSPNNRIGGTTANAGNVISGNKVHGIAIEQNGASGNLVYANRIGVNAAGVLRVANLGAGISIDTAPNTIVGGSSPAMRNILSGNNAYGVRISANTTSYLSYTKIKGNFIGTDASGSAGISNGVAGIYIITATNNTIGGTVGTTPGGACTGDCNLVYGTTGMMLSAPSNTVQGNFIGLDSTGTAIISGMSDGLVITGGGNTIGGTTAAARNVIAGYAISGLSIASLTTVQGNFIGTDTTGKVDLTPGGNAGIYISGGSSTIGAGSGSGAPTSCTAPCNLISGNKVGIHIYQNASGNTIAGNFIGTDITGKMPLTNSIGIKLETSLQNTIGGLTGGMRNLISGNTTGVLATNSARSTLLQGNYIGTDVTGAAALPNQTGIRLDGGAYQATIGGTLAGSRNIIAGNSGDGISIASSGSNTIQGNSIGVSASGTALPNGGNGILIATSYAETIASNVIANNGGAGILIQDSSNNYQHKITQNSIYANGGLGIDLGPAGVTPNDSGDTDIGANHQINFPVLTNVVISGTTQTITGTLNVPASALPYHLEFFGSSVCDASGNGEGETYLGTADATTDASGNASFTATVNLSGYSKYITATTIDVNGDTSEFSACFLPLNPPTGLQAKAGSPASITLTWIDNAVSETEYRVERSIDSGTNWTQIATVPANTTTYTDSTVLCQLPYMYRVRAYHAPGDYSMYTSSVAINTLCSIAAPTNLTVSGIAASQIALTWTDNATNETLYAVERSSDGGTTWTELTASLGANTKTYTDSGLTCETVYSYRVRAGHSNSQRSDYSNVAAGSTMLCSPTGLTAAASSTSDVKLSWNDNSNSETGYLVLRNESSGPFTQIAIVPANSTSYTDTSGQCNVSYSYRVQAVRSSDNLTSSNSNTATGKTLACPPADLSLTLTASGASLPETGQATYMLTLTNSGPNAAPRVKVRFTVPSVLNYLSSTPSQGSFDQTASTWTVGDLAANSSVTLAVTALIPGGRYNQTIAANAEVTASNAPDPDSTPNNSKTTEDDWAAASFTVGCAPASVMNVAAGDVQGFLNALAAAANETCFPGVDTIRLAAGSTYSLTKAVYTDPTYGSSGLTLGSSVIVEGNGARIERSSSASASFRLMQVGTGTITLNNLTLANAVSTSSSGTYGNYGGAIFVLSSGNLTLNNIILVRNTASYGGAVANRGILNVNGSLFDGNTASLNASAIGNFGTLSVTNTTFLNHANSSVVHNQSASPALFQFNTFVDNTASTVLWVQSGTVMVVGSLFARSTNPVCNLNTGDSSAHIVSNGYNLNDENSCAGFFTQPTDQNNTSAKLGLLANNGGAYQTYAPLSGSPAIDAVPAANCSLTTDGRGAARPADGNGDGTADCDIGAVEVLRTGLTLTKTADRTTGTPGDALTYTVTLANAGPQPAAGLTVTDKLPLGFTLASSSASQGQYSSVTGLWTVGNLNAGESATLTLSGTINNLATGLPLNNTASLTSSSSAADVPDANVAIAVTCTPQTGVSFTVPAGDTARLVEAVSAANNETCFPGPNTITLTNSTYVLTGVFPGTESDPSAFPVISSAITIEGSTSSIRRDTSAGVSSFRLFTIAANGNLTLNQVNLYRGIGKGANVYNQGIFTATDTNFFYGNAYEFQGGSIYNSGTLMLTRAKFSNNNAAEGGAIYNTGTMTLIDANPYTNGLNGNISRGGAVFNAGTAVIKGGVFSGNSVSGFGSPMGGGGIFNKGTLTISGARFSGDSGSSYGGDILQQSGTLSVTDTTFYGSTADTGGFIYQSGGETTISRSLFSYGGASTDGAAIFSQGGILHITNSTFSSNRNVGTGHIVSVLQGTSDIQYSTFVGNTGSAGSGTISGNITLTASLFGGNTGGSCSGSILSGGYNIAEDATCNFSGPGDLNNVNPLLAPITDNGGPTSTHALYNGSVAIDHVPANVCSVATDQRGVTRPQGDACDAGAFEGGVPNSSNPYPTIMRLNTQESTSDSRIVNGEVVDAAVTYFEVYYDRPMSYGNTLPRPVGDVANAANYLLVSTGANGIFETSTCTLAGDDQRIPVSSGPFYYASSNSVYFGVNNNVALPANSYRLLVCNVEDTNSRPLDGNGDGFSGDPYIISFTTDSAQFKADLIVTQTDSPDPVSPGGSLSYTVTVKNAGPHRAFNVSLTDKLPTGVTYTGATGATCNETNGTVTCGLGTILSGASISVTLNLTVGPTTIGTLTNTASVTSTTTDPTPANNTNITETTTANEPPAADIVVNNSGDQDDGICGLIHCTLREAINAANAHPGADTVRFNLPGDGPYLIRPTAALPSLAGSITLDGWSQPGFTDTPLVEIDGVNAGAVPGLRLAGSNNVIRGLIISDFAGDGIIISNGEQNTVAGSYIGTNASGTAAKPNRNGIVITNSANNIIGGTTPAERNVISGNSDIGVSISGSISTGNLIQGNFIGTTVDGKGGLSNRVGVGLGGPNNLLGGTTGTTPGGACTGACNLISSNRVSGVAIGARNLTIQGNFIGSDVTGKAPLGNGLPGNNGENGYGVGIFEMGNDIAGTLIGGPVPAARNLISANNYDGIYFTPNNAGLDTSTVIQGNYIGTNTTGNALLGSQSGAIALYTINNTIRDNLIAGNYGNLDFRGGPNTLLGNRIGTNAAGNARLGSGGNIYAQGNGFIIGGLQPTDRNIIAGTISLVSSQNSKIQGNFIGVGADGLTSLGNNGYGIYLSAVTNSLVGGTQPGEGNTIAYNGKSGIAVYYYDAAAHIVGNSIYNNSGLGIDLLPGFNTDGVTPNDPSDGDTGPNGLQNYPVIADVTRAGGQVTVAGTLNSAANATFRLDFYASETCDPSGYGEGQTYLGSADQTTGADGYASFSIVLPTSFPRGQFVTATATSASGQTSEFSACFTEIRPPSSLTMTVLSSTSVKLAWADNTSFESGFRVERSANGTTGWTEIASVDANVTEYIDSNLVCDNTVYYRVRARIDELDAYSVYSNIISGRPCTQRGPVFTVTHTAGTDDGVCDVVHCTLREAINAANKNTGPQTINLAAGAVYTLTGVDNQTTGPNGLPTVSGEITINGNGAVIERSAAGSTPNFRLFYVRTTGKLTLDNLTLRGGSVPYVQYSGDPQQYQSGAAVFVDGGQVTLNHTTVTGNTAYLGAGIFNYGTGTVTINGSTFASNSGDAVNNFKPSYYTPAGTVTATNSTFVDNGLANSGTMSVVSSTLLTTKLSGALLNNGGTLTLRANLIGGPSTAPCYGSLPTSQGYNLILGYSCNLTGVGDQTTTDFMLGTLRDNGGLTQTIAPQPYSPAVDAIPAESCPTEADQRDKARPADGNGDGTAACDIGAFELTDPPTADLSLAQTIQPLQVDAGGTLTIHLTLTNGGPDEAGAVQVKSLLPGTVQYVSSSAATGSYNATTGLWDIGALPVGSATLDIVTRVNTDTEGMAFDAFAEVVRTDALDSDSKPGNGITTEDDYAAVSMTVTCPAVSFNIPPGDSAALVTAVRMADNERCYPGADTIRLAANSTYTLTASYGNLFTDALPNVDTDITIEGEGATIQRSGVVGTGSFRLLTVNNGGSLTLRRLTLRGFRNNWGGTVIANRGTVAIVGSTITDNVNTDTATAGGALANLISGARMTITDSVLSNNTGFNGGALVNGTGGTLELNNTTLSSNSAMNLGGAIYNWGVLNITGSALTSLSANTANGSGGAIYNGWNGKVTLVDSTLTASQAGAGGAIYNDGGVVNITNSTFSNNRSTFTPGSVIATLDGTVSIINSTLAGNTTPSGTLYVMRAGVLRLKNTILANAPNLNCAVGSAIISDGYNMADDESCSSYLTQPTDQNNVNPLLGSFQNNGGLTKTYSLKPGSAAKDAVPLAQCANLNRDQRGIARPQGSACDIGAYEAQTSIGAPSQSSIASTEENQITLKWDDTFNETAFHIERSPQGANQWQETGVVDTDVTTFQDKNLICNTTYDYRVRAYRDPEGIFSAYSPIATGQTGACTTDLAVSLSTQPAAVTAGTAFSYLLRAQNIGPNDASAITASITLPAGVSLVNVPDACAGDTTNVTCQLDSLAKNGESTFTIDVQLSPEMRGTLVATGAIASTTGERKPANNTVALSTTIVVPSIPGIPVLSGPAAGALTNDTTPDLSWKAANFGYRYQVQVSSNSAFTTIKADGTVQELLYSPATALADGLYYWRVRAVNSVNVNSSWSAARTFTVDTAPPAVPNLSTPVDKAKATSGSINFVWLPATSANRYHLELGTDDQFSQKVDIGTGETASTSLLMNRPLGQGTYYWHIQARDAAGNWGSWSATRSFTLNNLLTPATGANLISPTAGLRPTFTWTRLTGATSYTVEVARDADFQNKVYTSITLPITASSHVATQLLPYGMYYWRVIAGGLPMISTVYNRFVVTPALPGAPVLLTPASGTLTKDSTPSLTWKPVAYALSAVTYEVQVDTVTTFANPKFTASGLSTTATDVTIALTDGRYYWRVRAVNQWGGTGVWSAARLFTVDTTPPAVPKLSKPLNNSSTTLKRPSFIWIASTSANGYEIELSQNGVVTTASAASALYVPPSNLTIGVYTWRVRARDVAGNWSDWSSSFTLTIQ
jgi:uncharacterized repeat protein (TIGR01451 family)/CSLREA domain-containing protein